MNVQLILGVMGLHCVHTHPLFPRVPHLELTTRLRSVQQQNRGKRLRATESRVLTLNTSSQPITSHPALAVGWPGLGNRYFQFLQLSSNGELPCVHIYKIKVTSCVFD